MFTLPAQKKISYALIAVFLFLLGAPVIEAKPNPEKEAARVASIKAAIAKLGTGPDATIKVKLNDKTKLAGYITQANAESFVLADAKTGVTTEIPYPNVTQAKGNNLSTGAAIAIGIGIGVGATLLTLFILAYALAD